MKSSALSETGKTTLVAICAFLLSGCATSTENTSAAALSQEAAIREACGTQPVSTLRNSVNYRRTMYSACKRGTRQPAE